MTRKHFAAVAARIRKARMATTSTTALATIDSLARSLADEFATLAPAFRRDSFLEACGVS